MSLIYASAQQQFVYNVTSGAVTESYGGSWLAAYALWLGATAPKGTWLETVCLQLGITQPVNGSWVQALALYYGITDTVGYGNWWLALADASSPVTNQIWGTSLAVWGTETDTWALV